MTRPPILPDALAAESERTWAERREPSPAIAGELRPPSSGGPRNRLRAMRRRHLLREQRAADFVASTLRPERGLPVASGAQVRSFVGRLLKGHRLLLGVVIAANVAAGVAALFVPRLLGDLVDLAAAAVAGGDPTLPGAAGVAITVAVLVLVQALMTFAAQGTAAVLGQNVLATAREFVVRAILALPLSRVEGASTGDLVTRVTRDVGTMSMSVRWGLPQAVIAAVTVALTIVAMAVNSLLLAAPVLVLIVIATVQVRRYLQRAPKGYLTEGGTYSQINTTLTETVEGARTVEAFRLFGIRRRAGDDDIEVSAQAERYTMTLRNLLFIVMDLAFSLPRVVTLSMGAIGYANGWVSLGQITTAMLYTEALWGPFDMLVSNIDRLQVGLASTTRLLGIATVPPDREPGEARPRGSGLAGDGLRYAYREGHDVLHGIDLDLRPGERLAIVGPSGSGKSTLGRLLSGIHGPRQGRVRVGGVDLTSLPLDVLRTEVALVTQEHHVFIGSVRDNIVLAREDADDAAVEQALEAVDALAWVRRLPEGLQTMIGSGQFGLTPAQAQQVALARLILADPHTIVLDEATSLIDPRTARHLEGSMNALLTGRTVVAIAHRLHTAHDADRIAVVIDGRIVELGAHDELIALDGEYAALWRAWTA